METNSSKCLEPGIKFNEEDGYSKIYACSDKSHRLFKSLFFLSVPSNENIKKIKIWLKNSGKLLSVRFKTWMIYSGKLSISCYSQNVETARTRGISLPENKNVEADVFDSGIFMLQAIEVESHKFNLFFDRGSGDMVFKKSAEDCLLQMGRSKMEVTGPITHSGVGDQKCAYH